MLKAIINWLVQLASHISCAYHGHAFIPGYSVTYIRRNNQYLKRHVYTCHCCGHKERVRPKNEQQFLDEFKPRWENANRRLWRWDDDQRTIW